MYNNVKNKKMNHILDITREHCPMTLVRTKLRLAQMAEGDTLEVLLCKGEPLDNIPRSLQEQGYRVLSIKHYGGGTYKVTIEK